MARKSASNDAVRFKAQQMREAQERADRRMRNIVIAVVTVVVVAVVAVVAVLVGQQVAKQKAAENGDPAALGTYASGAPVILSSKGVGQADDSVPTLTEYFDYSCHICADIDVLAGQTVSEAAMAGEFNIKYQPVNTVEMPYQYAATTASLVVADRAPDKWVAFHHALLAYFRSQYKSGKGTVVQDLVKSAEQVRTIAAEAGVPQDVIDSFPQNAAKDYLAKSSEAWRKAQISGREGGLGTPEFVANSTTKIQLTEMTADGIVAAIKQGLGVTAK